MTTTIKAHWDAQDKNNTGWYAELLEDGCTVTDSVKISWPVDLDGYGELDHDDVREALAAEWPGAEIEISGEGR